MSLFSKLFGKKKKKKHHAPKHEPVACDDCSPDESCECVIDDCEPGFDTGSVKCIDDD
ncbi:MAG: hypothetical protein E6X17_13700 [Sporomusaceae bacterium]|nr:hypothetical protein [Sporomusaceae bacterium]